ncbi:MAG: DUF4956 domain-containing protein [Deltaproteobacteria bacterium]|nr:DUF4956 domain-containing protein [Deltaproteobacteria bacterium]
MDKNVLMQIGNMLIYSPADILINMSLAVALGLMVCWVYRYTHKGLSYSQSFVLTLVFVSVIVSSVMMIIGNSLARAFALVGALSIIRFRTVVKDTKDTAYVFFALAVGMASGTGNYFIAVVTTVVISVLAVVLYKFNFGALYKSEFILRFQYDRDSGKGEGYLDVLKKFAKRSNLLHVEPSGDGRFITVTYDIILKENVESEDFSSQIAKSGGVAEVTLIASKSDVDF